jgi:hypothetical protein
MFGGQTFGSTYFGGILPWIREQARQVSGWGPPADSLVTREEIIEPEPLLTLAIGVPPTVNPQDPFVPDEAEELLVLLGAL